MVKYSCSFCNKNYDSFEEAEKCEKQGLIGPDLQPGLLLSSKNVKNGFKIFYSEKPSEGHERYYEFEEFLVWQSTACPLQHYRESASDLLNSFERFQKANKKGIDKVNKLLNEDFPGIGVIKVMLEENNVKKVHNNLELKVK